MTPLEFLSTIRDLPAFRGGRTLTFGGSLCILRLFKEFMTTLNFVCFFEKLLFGEKWKIQTHSRPVCPWVLYNLTRLNSSDQMDRNKSQEVQTLKP